jgi:hypothetical protein
MLAAGTGSVSPRLPAAQWDATEPGRPAWGGTEALLSLLSGPLGTIATLKTGNITGMLVQEVARPLPPPSLCLPVFPLASYLRLVAVFQ